ncbi:DUF2281 domain-containing protein [Marinobacter bryozoorum]|uniref:DUF2281 domain-containing protein n=1 Tax=Marinobacter bryozoorum TaxID=256324 RepID=UPI00200644A1|nr:DUF2281 domain-containing protein [Marinobacter bryozoorum]MCK7545313.1 DUF2281 domain-containing protein [Marinobacter bryozoorum]
MQLDELVSKVSRLPPSCQQEVLDFVAFLEQRYGHPANDEQLDWSDKQFKDMSVQQAMRGIEDEPDLYTAGDLKERWR